MKLVSPTEIGRMVYPNLSSRKVNAYLQELGLQKRVKNEWMVTKEGSKYSSCFIRQLENGMKIYQLKWNIKVKDLIQEKMNSQCIGR